MISAKIASIIALAAFVSCSFVASPELRAYAAATITSADIVDETIQSEDIKNDQVKSADIAANSVGASELKGVSKLIFVECTYTNNDIVPSEGHIGVFCDKIEGAALGDNVLVTKKSGDSDSACFIVIQSWGRAKQVNIEMRNECPFDTTFGTSTFSIVVYKP